MGYLNKIEDKNSKNYHCRIAKKPIHADYSHLTEEIEMNHKRS